MNKRKGDEKYKLKQEFSKESWTLKLESPEI